MTELLQKAFAEASKLDETTRDIFARWLLEEIRSEQRWAQLFADSHDELALLADEALREHRARNSD